jgi:hypothetical protein
MITIVQDYAPVLVAYFNRVKILLLSVMLAGLLPALRFSLPRAARLVITMPKYVFSEYTCAVLLT